MLLNQSILTCLRYWQKKNNQFWLPLDHGSEKELHLNLKLPIFNNQNDFYDIAKSSTDPSSKKEDNFYATMNLLPLSREESTTNRSTVIFPPSMFQTRTLQLNGLTHGRFKNLR